MFLRCIFCTCRKKCCSARAVHVKVERRWCQSASKLSAAVGLRWWELLAPALQVALQRCFWLHWGFKTWGLRLQNLTVEASKFDLWGFKFRQVRMNGRVAAFRESNLHFATRSEQPATAAQLPFRPCAVACLCAPAAAGDTSAAQWLRRPWGGRSLFLVWMTYDSHDLFVCAPGRSSVRSRSWRSATMTHGPKGKRFARRASPASVWKCLKSMIDSLLGWLIDWLIAQLTAWLIDWLIDWFDWLIDSLIGWLMDFLRGWSPLD